MCLVLGWFLLKFFFPSRPTPDYKVWTGANERTHQILCVPDPTRYIFRGSFLLWLFQANNQHSGIKYVHSGRKTLPIRDFDFDPP